MTTQNTHHEHNDADLSVVENQPVPESMAAPAASEIAPPAEAEGDGTLFSPESAAFSNAQGEEPSTTLQAEDQQQSIQEVHTSDEIPTLDQPELPKEPEQTLSSISSSEATFTQAQQEEIRTFADFIEEFRQAEAKLNASLRESQAEAFSLITLSENEASTSEQTMLEEVLPVLTEANDTTTTTAIPELAFAPTEERSSEEVLSTAQEQVEIKDKEESLTLESTETAEQPASTPAERTVSPLLRPAARLRAPRHSSGRHHREETENASSVKKPLPASTAELPVEEAPSEPVKEVETPRPARRYRFDRPAASNGSTQPSPQSRVEEVRSKENSSARAENLQAQTTVEPVVEAKQQVGAATQAPEPQKQTAAQESSETTTAPAENGRRRGHDRHKEPAVSPVAAVTPPAPVEEAAPQSEEIAPEDLPPLEYADLQKASSRRRRRHRSSNGTAALSTVSNVTPILPATPPIPSTPTPTPTPSAPSTANLPNQYSIVSGYTVSQMNQGNEASGPFMGPEPSPARGSVFSRDGRTNRAEIQRAPAYPTRGQDAVSSSASINQLANAVSQAIQMQTDRMVAELRRSLQAPTNVSVSLPPFPSTERVGVFVDVANLLYSARTLRIAVDFGKLLDFLRGNRRLVRAHAYCPTSPQPGDEQMFLQAVKGLGYRITTKNYKTFSSGAKKADLDLDLCMDVVRLVEGRAVDCVVLVSGDSDFMPMLDYCSDHGVRVEVAAFDEAMSATLRQSCDLFVNLSMLEEIRA